jgi:hypothetical protein
MTPMVCSTFARTFDLVRLLDRSTIANALEGMTPSEAARVAGMERQALRDAVVRYPVADRSDRKQAGAHRIAVHVDGAGSALGDAASELSPGQPHNIA